MSALLRRWQRRAVIVLAWLVLGLSVASATPAEPGRTPAALVCAAARGTVTVLTRAVAPVPRQARRAVARAVAIAPRSSLPSRARVAHHAPAPVATRDGRHLYLDNLSLLC